jgi:hypothetical protein
MKRFPLPNQRLGFDPNPPDPNTSEIQFANTGVAIDYVATPRNVTLDVYDTRLKRLESPIEEYIDSKLVCPKTIKSNTKNISCTLSSSISPFSDYDIQKLGYSPGTKVMISASQMDYVICVKAEDWGRVACENDLDLVPAYYSYIKAFTLGLGQSMKISVPNYLSKTGYTSVECGGPGCASFGTEYEVKGYKSPERRAATAIPSASEQKRMINIIKKGMNQTCQKLPSGFASMQGKFIKRANSTNGLMGYVYSIGGRIYIQLYDLGAVYWRFGPSPTKEDNKTWSTWGCGKSAIELYG